MSSFLNSAIYSDFCTEAPTPCGLPARGHAQE
jgi:hypothetical protein